MRSLLAIHLLRCMAGHQTTVLRLHFHLALKKQNELIVHKIRADVTVAACGSIKTTLPLC